MSDPASVNCNINLAEGAFCCAILLPNDSGTPPKMYAGTVAEPGRLRFMLDDDAPQGGGHITVYAPGMATWPGDGQDGSCYMRGEGPSIELKAGSNPFE